MMKSYLNDKELSWEAKGMLTYIINQSAGFRLNKKFFYSNFVGGRRKVDKIFSELEQKGFLRNVQQDVQNVQSVVQNVQQSDVQNVQQSVQNVQLLYNTNTTPYSPPSNGIKTNEIDDMHKNYLDWIKSDVTLEETFKDWIAYKIQKGNKWTPAGEKIFLRSLERLSKGKVGLAIKLMEKAIENDWKTVYKLKNERNESEPKINTDRL